MPNFRNSNMTPINKIEKFKIIEDFSCKHIRQKMEDDTKSVKKQIKCAFEEDERVLTGKKKSKECQDSSGSNNTSNNDDIKDKLKNILKKGIDKIEDREQFINTRLTEEDFTPNMRFINVLRKFVKEKFFSEK